MIIKLIDYDRRVHQAQIPRLTNFIAVCLCFITPSRTIPGKLDDVFSVQFLSDSSETPTVATTVPGVPAVTLRLSELDRTSSEQVK